MPYGAWALAALLASCKASYVAVGTQASIISVEATNPAYGAPDSNAINDDTSGHSYFPKSRSEASAIAHELLDRGHTLDVGLGQFNSGNFAAYNVTVDDMLDPCINVRVSGQLLETDWIHAFAAVSFDRRRERQAIYMTASLYNKNSLFGAPEYVERVVEASQTHFVRSVVAYYRSIVRSKPAARAR